MQYSLYRMLGEATGEHPSFDEILVTDVRLLGDTEDEVQRRIAELGEKGGLVRAMGESADPST